jgi:hypothetical protein
MNRSDTVDLDVELDLLADRFAHAGVPACRDAGEHPIITPFVIRWPSSRYSYVRTDS